MKGNRYMFDNRVQSFFCSECSALQRENVNLEENYIWFKAFFSA